MSLLCSSASVKRARQPSHGAARRGVAKAMAEGKFKGRREDVKRNGHIADLLAAKMSWTKIQAALDRRSPGLRIARDGDAHAPCRPRVQRVLPFDCQLGPQADGRVAGRA